MRKVNIVQNGCWEWIAYRTKEGYGVFQMPNGCKLAHRISYDLFVDKISDGKIVCHHCDNPSCVNPAHLFLGKDRDNSDDKVKKERHKFGTEVDSAKLNDTLVRRIRNEYRRKKINQRTLAKKYDVAPSAICNLLTYKTWRHVK